MTQAKHQLPKCTIGVYADKGSLRLSFSTRYNALLEQLGFKPVRQHSVALNLSDTDNNRKRAMQAALDIESDLQHKDWVKLFDPTFAKYGIGEAKFAQKIAEVINLPTATPQMTVGELWEDYLVWKEGQVQPTTFCQHYQKTYTNALKGLRWDNKTQAFNDTGLGVWRLSLNEEAGVKVAQNLIDSINKQGFFKLLLALKEATDRAIQSGKLQLAKNPFYQLDKTASASTIDKYKAKQDADDVWREWWEFEDEDAEYNKDVRAFTKLERDTIIKAFYEAGQDAKRHAAPLIEFLFLTGCRHGEAFALRWKDVSFERGYVRFSKSYNKRVNNTQQTKTGTIRVFKLYPRLTELLQRIKPADAQPNDLVFKLMNGSPVGTNDLQGYWNEEHCKSKGTKYFYPGIVTSLAQEGVLRCYLNPYSTRHTFITLQAHSGTDLVLLAAACGNSVEMIHKHYLGIDEKAEMTDI